MGMLTDYQTKIFANHAAAAAARKYQILLMKLHKLGSSLMEKDGDGRLDANPVGIKFQARRYYFRQHDFICPAHHHHHHHHRDPTPCLGAPPFAELYTSERSFAFP